jgi:diaminohydroxyphosphoribosylaminopyrimidine deaminase/5-amino-6-(5-phosphoribosylamino)uracil reductase
MHKKFLLAALEQAKLGQGVCAPNPCVGAVAVQHGQIIAQAFHKGAGTLHAEQLLLAQFPVGTPGISLYVTLEPCNHWGRTPPCVDAIIHHGIEQVVYGYADPNIIVAENDTPKLLRAHNIRVDFYPMAEIDAFYQSYQHWTVTKKPWVTVKMAQSLDGKIAGARGKRLQLSNELCAEFTHKQRAKADVILTSSTTINQDDPLLNARIEDKILPRPLAIIDKNLQVNPQAKAMAAAECNHIFYDVDQSVSKTFLNSHLHPTTVIDNHLDLVSIIMQLGALGYHDVWVEAGGEIFSALHELQLVNRTYLYIVPIFLGQQATTSFTPLLPLSKNCSIKWQAMDDNMIACMDWSEERCLQV